MEKIIVFVLEDQFVRFFLAAAAALVYYPFLLDEKSTWESPQPQNFCCQKEFFLSFGAPIAKKKGVCVLL